MLRGMLGRFRHVRGRREDELRARRSVSAPSGTFAGHRAYVDGDDLRYVDWNVYARTGDLHLKTLEEDERRTLCLIVDGTPSMLAGEPPRFDGARRLAAILGGMALVRLDGLRVIAGDGDRLATLEGSASLPRLLQFLEGLDPEPCSADRLAETPILRGWQGATCWISDFAVPDEFTWGLRHLASAGRRVHGVLPEIAEDRLPPVDGWVAVVDPETGARETVRVDRALRAALEQELRTLARQQDALFAAVGRPLRRFRVPAADDRRVAAWFPGEWIYRI
jgi:uncharacterized protein (DUF58 family)